MVSSFSIACITLAVAIAPSFAVKFKLMNNCKQTIWPGILGPQPIPWDGGLELKAGESKDINVPTGWRSNRIWARTGCDKNFNCETGFCGSKLKCSGAGGEPPVSLAEFTLASNANEKDFYDVSYVDGYNVQITVEPIAGTFKKDGGDKYSCTQAGKCTGGDPLKQAPEELKQKKNGKVVAVYTGCSKEHKDSYCCAGAHNVPEKCDPKKHWPKDLYTPLKKLCPSGYWYAYDDKTSTFTCKGSKNPSPDYKITFC
ncbi:thaumatin-like protein [Aphelenchoides avenae]|nr:thaumatin-like protein [Aphelenchus avenae]